VTHPRKLTRDAVKVALADISYDGRTLKRVVNRTQDLEHSDLPAAAVVTPEETSQRADKSGTLDRSLSVLIVIVIDAEAADDVDDELDAWAELVEDRFKQTPIGAAKRFTLTATSLDLPDVAEGETWLGFLSLEYEAEIFA
jgi:hypothetical protein